MKLSALIVTKNRPEFLPWLNWNIAKQTRQPDEIIVVDSTPCTGSHLECLEAGDPYAAVVDEFLRACGGCYWQCLTLPPETTTGEARAEALDLATGDVICWFDDDDYHHPQRLEASMEAIEKGAAIAYVGNTHRLILDDLLLIDLRESWGEISLPFGLFRKEFTEHAVFPPSMTAEDVNWYRDVVTLVREADEPITLLNLWEIPTMALIHGTNTWNRADLPEYRIYKQYTADTLPRRAPKGTTQEEWDETWHQLEALKVRLG